MPNPPKVFPANSDQNTSVEHSLHSPMRAKFARLYVESFNSSDGIGLRFEILGTPNHGKYPCGNARISQLCIHQNVQKKNWSAERTISFPTVTSRHPPKPMIITVRVAHGWMHLLWENCQVDGFHNTWTMSSGYRWHNTLFNENCGSLYFVGGFCL